MSVLLNKNTAFNYHAQRKPGAVGTRPATMDLAQLKLKQGAAVYQATIKSPGQNRQQRNKTRPQPAQTTNLWQNLPADKTARTPVERPRLEFKHFTDRNRSSSASRPPAAPPANRQKVANQRPNAEPARANLDLGFQHVLRGNAPAVLGEMAKNASPVLQQQDSKHRELTERFSAELEDALGSAIHNGNHAKVTAVKGRRREQRDTEGFAQQNSPQLANAEQAVPSFVPKHGVSLYRASGCNCVASFLGFSDSQ